jgi:acyl carrier protein
MGEIEQAQADELVADPNADLDLIRVNFESLTVIDFCLRIETSTGIAIDPDEMAAFRMLSELEAALVARSPG